jgi:hypothetical protein
MVFESGLHVSLRFWATPLTEHRSTDGGSGVPSASVVDQQQRQQAFAAAVSLRLSTFVTVIFI